MPIRPSRRLRQRQRGIERGDGGFTLIELSVAMFVMLIVMAALTTVFVGTLRSVVLSKQRQTATALATEAMEQMRSIDPNTLLLGHSCTDTTLSAANDPRLTGSSCAGGLTFTPTSGATAETLRTSGSSSTPVPLLPHLSTRVLDGVSYAVGAYVSTVAGALSGNEVNLTTVVSWLAPNGGGTKTVIQRSLSYSPSRCASSATHPFAGPCQAQFTGQAGLSPASIQLTNADDATLAIPGFSGLSVGVNLPGLSTTAGLEQIGKLGASAQTSQATATTGSATTSGGTYASAYADNDPSSGGTTGTSGPNATSQTSSGTQSLSGSAGTLSATPSTGDTGSAGGQVAVADSSCIDADTATSGSPLTATGQPCTVGKVQSLGTDATASYVSSGIVKTFPVAAIAASPSAARAVVARLLTTGGPNACTNATGAGCISAQTTRTLGNVAVGGLTGAAGEVPVGWTGAAVRVTGLAETAVAESGIGTTGATNRYTRTAGTLTYWNGASMTSVNLATLAADTTYTPAPVAASYTASGHTLSVTVATSVKAGAATAASATKTGTVPCKVAACSASAGATSAVAVTTTYTVNYDGALLTKFTGVVDLGSLIAQTSFRAAFDG